MPLPVAGSIPTVKSTSRSIRPLRWDLAPRIASSLEPSEPYCVVNPSCSQLRAGRDGRGIDVGEGGALRRDRRAPRQSHEEVARLVRRPGPAGRGPAHLPGAEDHEILPDLALHILAHHAERAAARPREIALSIALAGGAELGKDLPEVVDGRVLVAPRHLRGPVSVRHRRPDLVDDAAALGIAQHRQGSDLALSPLPPRRWRRTANSCWSRPCRGRR